MGEYYFKFFFYAIPYVLQYIKHIIIKFLK